MKWLSEIFSAPTCSIYEKWYQAEQKQCQKVFFRKVDDRETNRPGLILRALKGHYDVLAHKHQQKHNTQSRGVSATLGGDFWSGFSQPQSDRKSFTRRKTLDSSLLHFLHWSERDRGGENMPLLRLSRDNIFVSHKPTFSCSTVLYSVNKLQQRHNNTPCNVIVSP